MEADLVIHGGLVIPGHELLVSASRSSGPGGQHVNKTSSKISLRWSIAKSQALNDEQRGILLQRLASRLVQDGELLIHVESERSQYRNRRIARERLAELVEMALRPRSVRKATKPSRSSQMQRVDEKKRHGLLKKIRRAGWDY